jgi:hypothetical protein
VTGALSFPGNVLDSQTTIKVSGLEADIGFMLSDVSLEQIDSIGDPLELFQPISEEASLWKIRLGRTFGNPFVQAFAGTIGGLAASLVSTTIVRNFLDPIGSRRSALYSSMPSQTLSNSDEPS